MALIEVFHVVASQMPIDADNATDIPQGAFVMLDANAQVVLPTDLSATRVVVGLAGDSRSAGTTSYTPESGATNTNAEPPTTLTGALVLGAYGDQRRYTQNRVADNYNEVLASGKMTIYHGGGEFWTDQYVTTDVFVPGIPIYSNVTGDVSITALGPILGTCLNTPTGYPSGVPGTGTSAVGFTALPEGGNSLQWGTFLHIKLII